MINIKKFMELRDKVQKLLERCTIDKEKVGEYYPYGKFLGSKSVFFQNTMNIEEKSCTYISTEDMDNTWILYQQIKAIDSMFNVLDDISPIQYVMHEAYLNGVCSYFEFTQIEIEDILSIMLELGSDFPDDFKEKIKDVEDIDINSYQNHTYKFSKYNRFGDETKNYFSFGINDDLMNTIKRGLISRLKTEIMKSESHSKDKKILARIMSEEEIKQFKELGMVTSFLYEGERIWDSSNEYGKKGYYTFMLLDNRENILLNYSSVIPYLKNTIDKDKKNFLVMFEYDKEISDEMIYNGKYYRKGTY